MTGTGDGQALARALDYAAEWHGRRVVVKAGGSLVDGDGTAGTVVPDLALLRRAGVNVVLVHGGGSEVTRVADRLGLDARFAGGLRVTDGPTLEVVEMVLAGGVNKRLVAALQAAGARAVGMSGVDGGLLRAGPHPEAERLGHVGRVEEVDTAVLRPLLEAGFLPVISPLAGDGEGGRLNVNADAAAASLAVAAGAEKLILLTDVPGILDGPEGEGAPISVLTPGRARRLVDEGVVSRGMIPKVEACLDALDGGVPRTHIVGGRSEHALLRELFTEEGAGTMLVPEEAPGSGPHAPDASDGSAGRAPERAHGPDAAGGAVEAVT